MIHGSCLGGAVTYEFEAPTDDFVLCHCNRCKKSSGSAFVAGVMVSGLRFLSGANLIKSYDAPVLVTPPNYRHDFCITCGSPVPRAMREEGTYMVPAGSLDEDPHVSPREHVWVNLEASWEKGLDTLPRLTEAQFVLDRVKKHEVAGSENVTDLYQFIIDRYSDNELEAVVVAAAQERLTELLGPPT